MNSLLVMLMPWGPSSWLIRMYLHPWVLGGESGSLAEGAPLHRAALLPQGMSETFETLHNLVHKGVKVVMDIPYELWNETSAEVADLKKQVLSLVGLALGGRCGLVGWSTEGERVLGVCCQEGGC